MVDGRLYFWNPWGRYSYPNWSAWSHSFQERTEGKGNKTTRMSGIFIECCCDPNSGLEESECNISEWLKTWRFRKPMRWECCKSIAESVERAWVCRSWPVGFTCKPWTNSQQINIWRYGKPYLRKLMKQRAQSRKMLSSFLRIARVVLAMAVVYTTSGLHIAKVGNLLNLKISAMNTR